jgi:glucose/arabinose dehydrogenase
MEPGVLASGYWIPDGIAVIGEDEFLFADRGGALYHYVGGGVTGVRGLPQSRTSGVYGGLLDVSLHPSFPDTRLVYIAYVDASFGLAVARFELRGVSDMSEGAARAVSILPVKFWGPDNRVAPSGLLFVEGSPFASWNGAFLFGALRPQHLLRYDPATDATEVVLRNVGRVRDIAQLPSGKLLIAVDAGSPKPSDRGRIIELSPR